MKRVIIFLLVLAPFMGEAQKKCKPKKKCKKKDVCCKMDLSQSTFEDSCSYAFGIIFAKNLQASGAQKQNVRSLMMQNGFVAQMKNDSIFLSEEQMMDLSRRFVAKMRDEKLKANKAFLDSVGQREGVTTTPSGLRYEVLKAATGEKPSASSTVKVHYVGTLLDGTEFDSSIKRGQPAEFPLNGVIKGWTEGLQYMNVGSKVRFYIPSDLGYGERGTRGIPGDSILIFEVELLEIK